MAKRSNPEEMFQAARELEQIIAEELWATRPQDRNWDTITFKQNVTGGVNDHIALIETGNDVERRFISDEIHSAAEHLRKVMYQAGQGA
jgi:hypothetical protein